MSIFDSILYPIITNQDGNCRNWIDIPEKFFYKTWMTTGWKSNVLDIELLREVILNWDNDIDDEQYSEAAYQLWCSLAKANEPL
jgi:hypothetical protein